MNVLAIETATTVVGVALVGDDGVLGTVEIHHGRRHAEVLAPAIDFVCEHAQSGLDTIGGVVVDVGPGLFTGMRVGIASASALAFALDVPVVGVSSLEVLAAGAAAEIAVGDEHDAVIAAVVDARKGEVFHQFFRRSADGVVPLGEAATGGIDDLNAAVLARGQRVLAVGDGAWRYRGDIEGDVEILPLAHPSPVVLARVGRPGLIAADLDGARAAVAPLYLRAPDAQINWTQRS